MKQRPPLSSTHLSAPQKRVSEIVVAFLRRAGVLVPVEFPDRIEKLAINMMLWGPRMNLTARPEDPDEIAFHIIDSMAPLVVGKRELAERFSADRKVLDLGSGAGFPALVLAAASCAHFTLSESRRKRASFLTVAAAEMGLVNVLVDSTRVDASRLKPQFDVVTARALGPSPEFLELSSTALKPGGVAILYANPSQRLSLDGARAAGLSNYMRIAYQVPRRAERVSRVLALWCKC